MFIFQVSLWGPTELPSTHRVVSHLALSQPPVMECVLYSLSFRYLEYSYEHDLLTVLVLTGRQPLKRETKHGFLQQNTVTALKPGLEPCWTLCFRSLALGLLQGSPSPIVSCLTGWNHRSYLFRAILQFWTCSELQDPAILCPQIPTFPPRLTWLFPSECELYHGVHCIDLGSGCWWYLHFVWMELFKCGLGCLCTWVQGPLWSRTKSEMKRNEVREGAAVGWGLALPAWLFSFGNSEESNNSKPNPAFQIIMKAYCVDVDRRERSFQ